jgi:hypothetical protein
LFFIQNVIILTDESRPLFEFPVCIFNLPVACFRTRFLPVYKKTMSNPQHFAFNQPFVVSELIDGEAVIMNLKSGNYYSARHTGALVWAWLEQGLTLGGMATALTGIYGGEEAAYSPDVTTFINNLIEQGLIVPTETVAAASPAVDEGMNPPKAYKPPVLEVYADMQDLLLLDPIHDIDEVGWPVAKPTRPASN